MQKFFVGVITAVLKQILTGKPDASNEEVKAVLMGFVRNAVHEGIGEIPKQLDRIEQQAVDRIDAMDGKMGNLQEQLMAIPGQVIGGVIAGVEEKVLGPINQLVDNINKLNPFNFGR